MKQGSEITDHLMTLSEAADFLKISRSTLYAWCFQRKIPFRKHGRLLVFSALDLLHWSKSQKVDPTDHFAITREFAKKSAAGLRSLKTEQARERSPKPKGDL